MQDAEVAVVPVWKALCDPGPMARLEALKADPEAPGLIFDRLCEGETLRGIASRKPPGLGLPRGLFFEWFTVAHADLYEAALKVRATDLALDALQASLDATPDDVAVRSLQAKVALHLAARFDRARYGERTDVVMLVDPFGDLLRRVSERMLAASEVAAPQIRDASKALEA